MQQSCAPLPESDTVHLEHATEPDHSFPVKVCMEIQRMRNRMRHMDPHDPAAKVFRTRLDSLEETLNEMEYEIVKLEDTPYNTSMAVKASFLCNPQMKAEDALITRVIKPQIHYKNMLIQAAEVEVSQGRE